MIRYLVIAILVIVADQVSKQLAEAYLIFHQPLPIVPSLNFTLAYNTGAAFSFLEGAGGWQRVFFIVVAVIAAIIIVKMLRSLRPDQFQQGLGLALILGGAVGNLIDRVLFAKVIDFIDVYYGAWHFATFNIADVAISIGAGLVILDALGWILPGMPKPQESTGDMKK